MEIAFGKDSDRNFTFAFISDSHITQIKGKEFVRNWDRGLIRAVAETNLMDPRPDFVFYGGDIAQLGKPEEIDHGLEILSGLQVKTHYVMGEHDYYLDLGDYWRKQLGPDHYSFDHKGVHFVVLNSILTFDEWTHRDWENGMARMKQMARLDNPHGSPFMVGEAQRNWLKEDLARVPKDTPVVVMSHSPLQKIFKPWNFWTEDAEQVQALLKPFSKVTVLYGHVHQIEYNQIGNISFHSAMATAWPWPYPATYSQKAILPAETHRGNEPGRSLLRTRRHRLAVHRHGQRRCRRQLPAAGQRQPHRELRQQEGRTGRYRLSASGKTHSAANPLLSGGEIPNAHMENPGLPTWPLPVRPH